MINSFEIAKRLNRRCDGSHNHVQLLNGRASKAQEYPNELCRGIIRGLKDQMRVGGRIGDPPGYLMAVEEGNDVWGDQQEWKLRQDE